MTSQPRLLGGRYQVGELLGYGGMAEVHRGRDLRLGRDVAIKMLRTDLARDATFQMRFRREAQNAASLNHPAIVAVYDTGEERAPTGEALPYIIMEFVNGRTLKEILVAEGRLMPRRALEITADICAALEFSHRHGIIHRDIKPGNVMLTQNGQVKVMDFGIARALASGATTMTQTSAVIGTAQYLSPEQARGEAVDARSDVYATGCVLYELLTGHPPFVGDNPVSVAYQHVREDPRPPSDSNREVPADIDAVVLKALAKNPLNRYQSAAEMRGDLLRAAAGRPVYATPLMREEEMATIPVAMPRAAGAGARGSRTGQFTRVPDTRRRRTSGWLIATLSALAVLAVVALTAGLILANQPQKVTVPGVVGKSRVQAEAELRAAKLVIDATMIEQKGCAADTVLSQTPTQGAEVVPNSAVKVNICVGPVQRTVPRVVGLSRKDAEEEIKKAGLNPKVQEVDSDKPENRVLETVPAAGEKLPDGADVVLKVSKGNLKAVTDVRGKERNVAEELLQRDGFKVEVVDQETDDPNQVGKVIDTSPKAGTLRPVGTRVQIFVGKAKPPPSPTGTPTPTP
jgi:beta-lactam-binding protein with PASTA domain